MRDLRPDCGLRSSGNHRCGGLPPLWGSERPLQAQKPVQHSEAGALRGVQLIKVPTEPQGKSGSWKTPSPGEGEASEERPWEHSLGASAGVYLAGVWEEELSIGRGSRGSGEGPA